jgi:hypothetical protein
MPGTLFLDALKKKVALTKGYPMGDGRLLKPDKYGEPSDADLYKVKGPIAKAASRLREAVKGEVDPNRPNYKNVQARLDAERSEGIVRQDKDITSLGVKPTGKSKHGGGL